MRFADCADDTRVYYPVDVNVVRRSWAPDVIGPKRAIVYRLRRAAGWRSSGMHIAAAQMLTMVALRTLASIAANNSAGFSLSRCSWK